MLQYLFIIVASVPCVVKSYIIALHITVYYPILLHKFKTKNYVSGKVSDRF